MSLDEQTFFAADEKPKSFPDSATIKKMVNKTKQLIADAGVVEESFVDDLATLIVHNASLQLWNTFVESMTQVIHRLTTHIDDLRALIESERARTAQTAQEMQKFKEVLGQTVSRYRLLADDQDFQRFVRETRLDTYLGIIVGLREFKVLGTTDRDKNLTDREQRKNKSEVTGLPSIHRRDSRNFDVLADRDDLVEARLRQIVNNSKNDLIEFDGILRGWTSWTDKNSRSKSVLNKEALARLERAKNNLEDKQFDQNTTMPRSVASKVHRNSEDFRRESDYLEILGSGVVERKNNNKTRISLHAPFASNDRDGRDHQMNSKSQTSADIKPIKLLNNGGIFLNNIDYDKFGVKLSSLRAQPAPRMRGLS